MLFMRNRHRRTHWISPIMPANMGWLELFVISRIAQEFVVAVYHHNVVMVTGLSLKLQHLSKSTYVWYTSFNYAVNRIGDNF